MTEVLGHVHELNLIDQSIQSDLRSEIRTRYRAANKDKEIDYDLMDAQIEKQVRERSSQALQSLRNLIVKLLSVTVTYGGLEGQVLSMNLLGFGGGEFLRQLSLDSNLRRLLVDAERVLLDLAWTEIEEGERQHLHLVKDKSVWALTSQTQYTGRLSAYAIIPNSLVHRQFELHEYGRGAGLFAMFGLPMLTIGACGVDLGPCRGAGHG